MIHDTQLLEPVSDVRAEMVPISDYDNDPRAEGYPTKNQIWWRKRQNEDFRRGCMTKFGRDWFVHLPSLRAYLAGKRLNGPQPPATA